MDISKLEKGLFSNLQSEFYKFINVTERHPNKCSDRYLKKIIIMNEHMRLLENMIHELKMDIYTNRPIDTSIDARIDNEIENYDKDKMVLDYFKPIMIYYRLLLN